MYGTKFTSFELEEFFRSVAEPRASIRTSEDVVVSKVGRELYEKFFRSYTRKQWGVDPSELDKSVTEECRSGRTATIATSRISTSACLRRASPGYLSGCSIIPTSPRCSLPI